MKLPISVIAILIVLLIAAVTIGYIRFRIRKFSRSVFGTDDFMKGMEEARVTMESMQKSVPSLTKLLLPSIQKDFPQFNWQEYRAKLQTHVRDYIIKKEQPQSCEVHDTEIGDYRHQEGTCYITTFTSAGYLTAEDGRRIEKRYRCDILYVQDVSKLPVSQTGIGLSCPNCGAPVTNLGQKHCAYCGAAVMELNNRVWKLGDVSEDE